MGVDAKLLIRNVKHDQVNDEWLKEKSFAICESIGAKNFWISDGLPHKEYDEKNKAWHNKFNSHDLYAKWSNCPDAANKNALHEQIFADIGPVEEERRLAIDTTKPYEEEFEEGAVYEQDGPDILAQPWECLLQVSLWTRYYGPGYERGDILTICAICDWLEINIPGCEVWYGGDSSGICAEPFPYTKRREYLGLLYSEKGREYFRGGNRFIEDEGYGVPPACGLCPSNTYQGSRFGYGKGYASYHCPGCGISMCTRDAGNTWQKEERD